MSNTTHKVITLCQIYAWAEPTEVRLKVENFVCNEGEKYFSTKGRRFSKADTMLPIAINGNNHAYVGYEIFCYKRDIEMAKRAILQALHKKISEIKDSALLMHKNFLLDVDVKPYLS